MQSDGAYVLENINVLFSGLLGKGVITWFLLHKKERRLKTKHSLLEQDCISHNFVTVVS
jgi:hypothetical protein